MNRSLLSFLILAISLVFISSSCTRKVATASLSILNKDADGLISFQSEGLGRTLPIRERDAQMRILNEVIYNGIPSSKVSDVRLPLIDRRTKLSETQQNSVNELLAEKNISKYFLTFTRHSSSRNLNAKNKIAERFTGKLRLDLLRTDLENKGVIRKFGY